MMDSRDVHEDGETLEFRNYRVELRGGRVKPREEYFEMLDSLCDVVESTGPIQLTSGVGLGRAAATGAALGAWFTLHAIWAVYVVVWRGEKAFGYLAWCFYMMALTVYHMSEFFTTMRFNAPLASCESFLLDQSKQYQIAMLVSWVEFWVEFILFPDLKCSRQSIVIGLIGVALVGVGQFFRTGAMVTAKSNFTHLIQTRKAKAHRLVTSGMYRFVRHPSYFGWFWWSVGTQMLVCNPVCFVGFAAAAWKFFHVRIPIEEETLCRFFPDEYPEFRKRTPVGIPFL